MQYYYLCILWCLMLGCLLLFQGVHTNGKLVLWIDIAAGE